jgi:hypothetical protein|tara:strand:- start:4801 stop:4959 length:159 start_codon:yes stop_codon:yes gene_type:complete
MKKIIKIIGNSIGITFNKEEQEINNLDVGDVIQITIIKLKKNQATKYRPRPT